MTQSFVHSTFAHLDCDIHYWHKKGSGHKHILFFHGAGLDHNMFEAQTGIFDASYSLTLWDARGHGLSRLSPGRRFFFEDMISDSNRLFEMLGIEKAILIGQSMGGNLAQEISCRRPETVEKLVLIDCTRNAGKLTFMEKLLLKLSAPLLHCYPWETLVRQSADACSNFEEIRRYVRDCFMQIGKSGFIDIMTAVTGCLHEDVHYRFHCPTLLLCGADDRSGNIRKIAASWAESDENCTLHMIDGAGHNSNQDAPEIVNRHIAGFLAGDSYE